MTRKQIIERLLSNPEKMLFKRPFTRGTDSYTVSDRNDGLVYETTTFLPAALPNVRKKVVSQERFLKELDPSCHDVLFDDNLPSICVKNNDGVQVEIEYKKTAVNFQERIRQKKTLSLCGNSRVFTLHEHAPSDRLIENFETLKWYWEKRNQDGLDAKAVYTQLGMGDVGLLMYFNEKNEIRGRILSYEDGYVIISHNDDNGERVMECVYYRDAYGYERIDSYTDLHLYRFVLRQDIKDDNGGWILEDVAEHGFSEIPLITKRGAVAWNEVQGLIELFEIIYNIFAVIQKRHGWGILYIRGKFREQVQKIAGSIILNDTSMDGKGSAEFKTPPSPANTIEFLDSILDQIQIGSSVTFVLPKDVKTGGDISGVAMQMTRSFDIESASNAVIEWQNFADKHCRLFKEGLAKELVTKGENKLAITEYQDMKVTCSFKMWQPFDEVSYNQMLCTMKGAGIISTKTGIEKNTVSTPDEVSRVLNEQKDIQSAQQE